MATTVTKGKLASAAVPSLTLLTLFPQTSCTSPNDENQARWTTVLSITYNATNWDYGSLFLFIITYNP